MESNPINGYWHFILSTSFLLLGSILYSNQLHQFSHPLLFALGVFLVFTGSIQGSYFCYQFLRKISNAKEEGGYICPGCQGLNHPDAERCWLCNRLLDLPFDWIVGPQQHLISDENKMGLCCVCGEAGNYYRNKRWFCFQHRRMGR